ncbi:MAG: hypothetical protein WBN30_10530, partial [Polyangiales bacterium]
TACSARGDILVCAADCMVTSPVERPINLGATAHAATAAPTVASVPRTPRLEVTFFTPRL